MGDAGDREIGRVDTYDLSIAVGTDDGDVTLTLPGIRAHLTIEDADELAAHIITATWHAAANMLRQAADEDGNPGQSRPLPAVERSPAGTSWRREDPRASAASLGGGRDG